MERIRLPFFIFLLLIFILPLKNQAQTNSNIPKIKSAVWQQLISNPELVISYKYQDCIDKENGIDKEMIMLQFTNLLNVPVSITYTIDMWYNNKCVTCPSTNVTTDPTTYTLTLSPNQNLSPVCKPGMDNKLSIFSKFLNIENKNILTDFSISNLTVKK